MPGTTVWKSSAGGGTRAVVADTPELPASRVTYTQTYATADVTVATATVAAVATTAAATLAFGFGQAQADAIPVAINALTADVLVLRKLVNSLIDQLQASGIAF